MARLFISHSSANNAAAVALHRWLAEQGYDDVFLDLDPRRGLVAGDRWQLALKAAANRCEAVLFLVSPDWLASKWCLGEFILAKLLLKRIFGILVAPVARDQLPGEMTGEWQLCSLLGDGPQRLFRVETGGVEQEAAFLESGLAQLRLGLGRAGLDARTFPWPPAGDLHRAPYRGLRALEAEDAAIFFGRDAQIVRALDRVRSHVTGDVTMMVILGASGAGKSSFLRAGLWPRLARDDATFLVLPVVRPEAAVLSGGSGLALSLSAAFERLGTSYTPGRIKGRLARGAEGFRSLLGELTALSRDRLVHLGPGGSDPAIVLPLDQAEELFNPDGAEEAGTFLDLVAAVLSGRDGAPVPRVVILATIRSDRYELIQAEPRLAELARDLFDLPPIAPSEYKGIIEGPAHVVSDAGTRLTVDPALTAQLIADAQGVDALPLLGFTLERLFADYGGDGRLALADYQELGGMEGLLEAAVAQALAEPGRSPAIPASGPAQQAALRDAFIPWLARIDPETGVPMRRVARVGEIPAELRPIVERLVAARLLVADRRAGIDTVEVAHESLLRQWSALATWLEAAAGDLKAIEGVERSIAEWLRQGRQESWLDHRQERLAAANVLVARRDFRDRLGPDGVAYLAACDDLERREREQKEIALRQEELRLAEIAAAQTRTARLQRSARTALGILAAVVILGLGLIGWQQSRLGAASVVVESGRANLFAELARVQRLRESWDSALRLSVQGARLGLRLGQEIAASGRVQLVAAQAQSGWQLNLTRHDDGVTTAVFSPDGARLLTASLDGSARVWSADDGRELLALRGHSAGLRSAAYSADGSRIVTASSDGTARVWDAATGAQLTVLTGHDADVMSAVFSPDGRRILTSSFDRTAALWDAATGMIVGRLLGHADWLFSAEFSPDGARIVTASEDKTARIWDAATSGELTVLRGHDAPLYSATFSPDGARVATASGDGTGRLWDARTGKPASILRGHTDYLNAAAFSRDGTKLVTASGDKTARIWDAETGAQLAILRGHGDYLNSAAFSPDGLRVVTAAKDRTARVWPVARDRSTAAWQAHGSEIMSAAFSPDGSRIVTTSADRSARIWDGTTLIATLDGHEAGLRAAAFSPDGRTVVTASQDRTGRLWDARTGKQTATLRGHENWVLSAAYSPDGSKIVTASWDGTVRIWDAASARQLAALRGHTGPVWAASFSPDGTRIVSASSDRTARLWDAATGRQIDVIDRDQGRLWSAAFSPDGGRLVTAGDDGTARIWDIATRVETAILRGHEGLVASAAFSPDGGRVITASADGTARIWEAATGLEVTTLLGHEAWVSAASYRPDGRAVVTASRDRTVRLWEAGAPMVSTEELIRRVCSRKLGRLSVLDRDEMRLAGYVDRVATIDACEGVD